MAAKVVSNDKPVLVADGGVENFNGAVDKLIASGRLRIVGAWLPFASSVASWINAASRFLPLPNCNRLVSLAVPPKQHLDQFEEL
ncbi:hypothetical protein ETAA8_44240 [Anatilimnocola aggregata]|uniref:Uncharacterized protein n=1 Tax=Anatilimnocola aggregata TaxID=2528021 RepID=A0A517YGG1_9BACT|nr:hypothetical protein [Anatilimnocola aggregata]QDU29316.1 hypothetical protein ETAA8_44240 [Anatilimnocola aggregata]